MTVVLLIALIPFVSKAYAGKMAGVVPVRIISDWQCGPEL